MRDHGKQDPLLHNGAVYVLLYEFERAMRAFILYAAHAELSRSHGDAWESYFYGQISPDYLKDIQRACQREKDIAIYTGMNIDYAKEDFLPFSFISEATTVWWDRVFAQYFKHKQYFLTDVDKIKNVRNAVSHFRGITPDSQLQTISICKRLLGIIYALMPAQPSAAQAPMRDIFGPPQREGESDEVTYNDLVKVYPVRNDAQRDVQALLRSARRIEAMGISINELTTKIDDRTYRSMLKGGAEVTLLMLDPKGTNVGVREAEERCETGNIAMATVRNLQRIRRFQSELHEDELGHLASRIKVVFYDEIPRCNMIFIDEEFLFVQYYAGHVKGENNPTFYLRRKCEDGVYDFYRRLFRRTLRRWDVVT